MESQLPGPSHKTTTIERAIKRRRSYPLTVRRDIIRDLEEKQKTDSRLSVIEYCRSKGLDPKQIRNWRKQMSAIEEVAKNDEISVYRRRQIPRERRPKYPLIDAFVLDFLIKTRVNRMTIDGEDLKIQAKIAYEQYYPTPEEKLLNPFKASNGWFQNFTERNHIVCRSVTSIGHKIPPDAKYLALDFFDYIDRIRNEENSVNSVQEIIVWNMDEVPTYFDSPKNSTYDLKGVKDVAVRTSGNEKTRFTVILCADNSGRKLKPGIIFKGLVYVPVVNNNNNKFKLFAAKGGSVDTGVMDRWRQIIFANRPGFNSVFNYDITNEKQTSKTLLLMDSHGPHKNEQILRKLKRNNGSHVAILPGGLTPLLQPIDLGIGKLFKENMSNYWNVMVAQKMKTKEEIKKPSYQQICDWVVDAWDAIPEELIVRLFESVNLGKTYDETKIHSRLLNLMCDKPLELEELEHTGISDAESDVGEIDVTLDLSSLNISADME